MSHDRDPPARTLDAETLAAFIDGRLAADARADVVRTLATSDSDYEAYVDALGGLAALDAAGIRELRAAPSGPAPVARTRTDASWRSRRRLLALAAVLAAAVAVPLILFLGNGAGRDLPATLVAALEPDAAALAGAEEPAWRTLRAGEPAVAERELAFRLGVQLVRLEAAARAGDEPVGARMAAEIAALAASLPGGAAYAASYRELQLSTVDARRAAELRRTGGKALAATLPAAELRLGAFTGAALLALRAGDVTWFDSPAARQARDAVAGDALAPATRAAWLALRERLDAGHAATDPEGVEAAVQAVVAVAAG